MSNRAAFLVALLGLAGTAGAVTITVDLERLQDASGVSMPVTGLVVLTAGGSGSFFGPTPDSFAGGDEFVLIKWDLSAFLLPGVIQDTLSSAELGGAWEVGDPLRVYWYPSLTLASPTPGAGTAYGTYRDSVGLDGSDPWTTPANGDSIALKFFTSDASFLSMGGSNLSEAGRASLRVVPEPGPLGLLLAGWVAIGGLRRRTV